MGLFSKKEPCPICGFAPQMEAIGQLFKHIVRKEPVTIY